MPPDAANDHALKKLSTLAAVVLWCLSFALAFIIPKSSTYIWIPDFLLLLGFIPLLFVWPPSWPWLVFGVLNAFIGFTLEVSRNLTDSQLPPHLIPIRAHLAEYHAPMVWIFVGLACVIYGLLRMLKNIIVWSCRKFKIFP